MDASTKRDLAELAFRITKATVGYAVRYATYAALLRIFL